MTRRHDDFEYRSGQRTSTLRVGSTFLQPPPPRPGRPGTIRGWLLAVAIGLTIAAVLTGMNLA